MKDASIYMNYEKYKEIYNDLKKIEVKVNFDEVLFPESLLNLFIYNQSYYRIFKKALFEKFSINIFVMQSNEIIIKKVYTPISILEGIKKLDTELPKKFASNFSTLVNKTDFKKYISKNKNKIFSFKIDDKIEEIKYGDLTKIILDASSFNTFLTKPEFTCMQHVFLLKEFMKQERILLSYLLSTKNLEFYKILIQNYDTLAFNKNVVTNFKYSNKFKINSNFEKYLFNINTNNNLKKAIYLYINLISTLKYDFEYIDSSVIKKHEDLTRIEYIDTNNNRVMTFEFSLIFAKCLEKLKLNFDYSDNFIIVRIEKFIVRFNSIEVNFNIEKNSIFELLNEVKLLNNNKETKFEFNKTINEITNELRSKKLNIEIYSMPLNKLNNIYKINSSKLSINFKQKYSLFYKLISNVNDGYNAIGYIFELKKILFNKNEINANINFNIIEENANPIVIITVNNTNINLYNSNKYIYYNPPKKIEELNLNEIRMSFFNGRFKYLTNSKESIIGIEKSNI